MARNHEPHTLLAQAPFLRRRGADCLHVLVLIVFHRDRLHAGSSRIPFIVVARFHKNFHQNKRLALQQRQFVHRRNAAPVSWGLSSRGVDLPLPALNAETGAERGQPIKFSLEKPGRRPRSIGPPDFQGDPFPCLELILKCFLNFSSSLRDVMAFAGETFHVPRVM